MNLTGEVKESFGCKSDYDIWVKENRAGLDRYWLSLLKLEEQVFAGKLEYVDGVCSACGGGRRFFVDSMYAIDNHINWRERLVCEGCGLNNRLRQVVQLMNDVGCKGRGYITEQVTPFAGYLRELPGRLEFSEFMGEGVSGGHVFENGIRHEDLTRLSFADKMFDYVISCDVIEHVPDYQAALREMVRVLSEDGVLIMSAPFRPAHYDHLVRAQLINGEVVYLESPEYHGDPVGEKGVLCFYHFGWAIVDELKLAGASRAEIILRRSDRFGNYGAPQFYMVARK